jgi:hypothetical protein
MQRSSLTLGSQEEKVLAMLVRLGPPDIERSNVDLESGDFLAAV